MLCVCICSFVARLLISPLDGFCISNGNYCHVSSSYFTDPSNSSAILSTCFCAVYLHLFFVARLLFPPLDGFWMADGENLDVSFHTSVAARSNRSCVLLF